MSGEQSDVLVSCMTDDAPERALAVALRDARTRLGMTLDEAATRSGLGRDLISRLEAGRRTMDVDTLVTLCHSYGLSAGDMLREAEGSVPAPPPATSVNLSESVRSAIRCHRKERGWSMVQLSERLRKAGHPLCMNAIWKIETGRRGIDIEDLGALAEAFGVAVDRLLPEPTATVTR